MRETKAECLIVRLSFLLLMKLASEIFEGSVGPAGGRAINPEPDLEVEALVVRLRIEGRFLGAVGAWIVLAWS